MRSAVILAGGRSTRMGSDKGQRLFAGVPLLERVITRLAPHADRVILVASTREKTFLLQSLYPDALVVTDTRGVGSPLDGLATGLRAAAPGYAFAAGQDMPFTDARVVRRLFEEAEGRDAATPYWPNGFIEPLHAVYHAERGAEAAERLLDSGRRRLSLVLRSLPDTALVPVEEIRRIDPGLLSLTDVDTPEAFAAAERIALDCTPQPFTYTC